MPYAGFDFDPIDTGESITLSFDFSATLSSGETPSASTWVASVASDSDVLDASASAIVTGSASITGNITTHRIQNVVSGCKYLLTATIVTNMGNTIDTYAHFVGGAPQ